MAIDQPADDGQKRQRSLFYRAKLVQLWRVAGLLLALPVLLVSAEALVLGPYYGLTDQHVHIPVWLTILVFLGALLLGIWIIQRTARLCWKDLFGRLILVSGTVASKGSVPKDSSNSAINPTDDSQDVPGLQLRSIAASRLTHAGRLREVEPEWVGDQQIGTRWWLWSPRRVAEGTDQEFVCGPERIVLLRVKR